MAKATASPPNMREEFARLAFRLFAERGINNVSLDEIAVQAGVTKGSLYWHYSSKKELILAAAALYYRDWLERAHSEVAASRDCMEQIRRVWRMSIDTCLLDREKRAFSTELFALGVHDPEIRASWAQFYDAVRELYVGLVRAACNAGALQVKDPRATVEWVLAAFEGIKHRASFQGQIHTAAQRDAMVDVLMRIVSAAADADV